MNNKLILSFIVIGLFVLSSAVLWMTPPGTPPKPALHLTTATMIQPPRPLPAFSLTTHEGIAVTKESLKGKWSLIFAGYTHCPDICPTALADLNRLAKILSKEQRIEYYDYQIYFLTVDPKRDTVSVLHKYIGYFNNAFLGLTGDETEIAKLTQSMSIVYMQVPGENPNAKDEEYLMDHSSAILIIDPEFRLAGIFSAPHDPEAMAADFGQLIKRDQ